MDPIEMCYSRHTLFAWPYMVSHEALFMPVASGPWHILNSFERLTLLVQNLCKNLSHNETFLSQPRCYNPTDSVYLRRDNIRIMSSGSTSHLEQKSSRMKVIAHIQSTLWHLIYIKLSKNKIFDCYVSVNSWLHDV